MFWPWETRKVKTVRVELCIDAQSLCFVVHPPLVPAKTLYVYTIIDTVNTIGAYSRNLGQHSILARKGTFL